MSTQSDKLPPLPINTPFDEKGGKPTSVWNQWFIRLKAKVDIINKSIVSISGGTAAGFLSSDGNGTINNRVLTAGSNVTITNPDGVAGNPVISATGGFVNPMTSVGDLIVGGTSGAPQRLAIGASGTVPTSNGTTLVYQAASSNLTLQSGSVTVTPVSTGQVITNIPIALVASTSQALITISYSSQSALLTSSPTSGVLTSVNNLQLTTDALIGSAHSQTVYWQVYAQIGTYPNVILSDSPVAYWHLGEASGTVASDSSGGGYNGTYSGTLLQGQPSILPGGYGASCNLQGTGYIVTPSTTALAGISAPVSLEAWIEISTVPSTIATIIGISNGGPQLAISSQSTVGALTFGYAGIVNGTQSTGVISANTKTHIVATCDVSGNITYYINGAAAGTGTTTVHTGSGNGNIGRYVVLGGYQWGGSVQEVAVYNTVLSSQQVTNHYIAA